MPKRRLFHRRTQSASSVFFFKHLELGSIQAQVLALVATDCHGVVLVGEFGASLRTTNHSFCEAWT